MRRHSRRATTFLALLLVASPLMACADARDSNAGGRRTNTDRASDPAEADAGGAGGEAEGPTTTSGADGSSGTTTTVEGATRPSGRTDASESSMPPPTTTAGGGPRTPSTSDARGADGPPGAFARSVLGPGEVTSLVVELQVQAGADPRPATIARVEETLAEVSGKQVSVAQYVTEAGTPPNGTWDEAAIVAYSDRNQRVEQGSARGVIRFLALKGSFGPEPSAIGVAVRGDLFAVFVDRVRQSGSPLVPASTIEEAVAVHELGHLLGLVDLVVDRNRDDPKHPFHSQNRDSVMFWAIETDLVGQVLGGPPPREFDADDRADLAAIRGGA